MRLCKQQKVQASLTDTFANLSVTGIFKIAEDAVTELMGALRIDGIVAKREYNAVWVVAKSRVCREKSVAWNEEISVEAFVSSVARATLEIDVVVKNDAGEVCAYVRMQLCALDLQTGRIRKVATVGVDDRIAAQTPEREVAFAQWDDLPVTYAGTVRVESGHIDFSHHTNNIAYVEFVLNTYSVAERESRPVREMEMVYGNQSFEGDVLTICKSREQNRDVFALYKGDTVITKSEIVFA